MPPILRLAPRRRGVAESTNLRGDTEGTFQCLAVPAACLGGGGIGGRQEVEQQSVRRGAARTVS